METPPSWSFVHTPLQCSYKNDIYDIWITICHSSSQCTAPPVHFVAVPQCSSWCRDRNMGTAIHRNADAVEYERHFTLLWNMYVFQHVSATLEITTFLVNNTFYTVCMDFKWDTMYEVLNFWNYSSLNPKNEPNLTNSFIFFFFGSKYTYQDSCIWQSISQTFNNCAYHCNRYYATVVVLLPWTASL